MQFIGNFNINCSINFSINCHFVFCSFVFIQARDEPQTTETVISIMQPSDQKVQLVTLVHPVTKNIDSQETAQGWLKKGFIGVVFNFRFCSKIISCTVYVVVISNHPF